MPGVRNQSFHVEQCESGREIRKSEDEEEIRRTGTLWTASAHIITAIIGSGVLSLAWGLAQLGWIAGVLTLLIFSGITLYASCLLADCYRCSNTGKRNSTYKEVVKSNLSHGMYVACAVVQYVNLCGTSIGYTITAAISMVTIIKSHCLHSGVRHCPTSYTPYMIGMGVVEMFLSQIPNFHKLSALSFVAAIMSFAYSSIGIGLSLARVVSGHGLRTSLTGVEVGIGGMTAIDKMWRMFKAFGNIAFAYNFSMILVEIQDTLKESPPENKVMKKANAVAVATTTVFYMMCGCFGYAAFGNKAPGNLLSGFGPHEPFWLVDFANACIVLHLVGAYQVFIQPVFNALEIWTTNKWPNSTIITKEYKIEVGQRPWHIFSVNILRLIWRTVFVCLATLLALALPFFNDILALLGAIGYYPLTVFFPTQTYIAKNKIPRWSSTWLGIQILNLLCLLVALAAASGAVEGLTKSLRTSKPFQVIE